MVSHRSTSTQIRDARPTLAILPVGSCEQHGSHLPVGTDAYTAAAVVDRVAEKIGAFALPTVSIGTSPEHRTFAGTVWLSAATLAAIVEDVALSLTESGIRRLAVLSGHGANFILRPAVRDINARYPDLSLGLIPEGVMFGDFGDDLHAGFLERSIMMALMPDAVGDVPPAEIPDAPREMLDLVPFAALTESGIWGDPAGATADEGRKALDAMVERVSRYLIENLVPSMEQREEFMRSRRG